MTSPHHQSTSAAAADPLEPAEQVRWVFNDRRPVTLTLRFEPTMGRDLLGRITVTITDRIAHGWHNERTFSRPARNSPRAKELKLTVSSNLVVRGPMQPWKLEILTPLIREFILEIVEEQGSAGAIVSVLAEKKSETTQQNVGQQGNEENDDGDK